MTTKQAAKVKKESVNVMPTKTERKYGWKPDVPDFRDFKFSPAAHIVANLPKSADIRQHAPFPMDQGSLGSCTGNAIACAHQIVQDIERQKVTEVSRLFIYYNERAIEGTIQSDAGAQIRDGFKVIGKYGAASEKLCPYHVDQFRVKPSAAAFADGLKRQGLGYQRLDNTDINQLKSCLAEGFPFVFGFAVYASFEDRYTAQTGIMAMPKKNEKMLGGHAVCAVGYNDNKKHFIIRNSWGALWGFRGDFFMPYDFITKTDFADDFWSLRDVE